MLWIFRVCLSVSVAFATYKLQDKLLNKLQTHVTSVLNGKRCKCAKCANFWKVRNSALYKPLSKRKCVTFAKMMKRSVSISPYNVFKIPFWMTALNISCKIAFSMQPFKMVSKKQCICQTCKRFWDCYAENSNGLPGISDMVKLIESGHCIVSKKTLSFALKNTYNLDVINVLINYVEIHDVFYETLHNIVICDVLKDLLDYPTDLMPVNDRYRLVEKLLCKGVRISNAALNTACYMYSHYPFVLTLFISLGAVMKNADFKDLFYGNKYCEFGRKINEVDEHTVKKILSSNAEIPDDFFSWCCSLYNNTNSEYGIVAEKCWNHYLETIVSLNLHFTPTTNDILNILNCNYSKVNNNVIKYMFENGCPMNESVMYACLQKGLQLHVIDYILAIPRDFKLNLSYLYGTSFISSVATFNMVFTAAMKEHGGIVTLPKRVQEDLCSSRNLTTVQENNWSTSLAEHVHFLKVAIENITLKRTYNSFSYAAPQHQNSTAIAKNIVAWVLYGEQMYGQPFEKIDNIEWNENITYRFIPSNLFRQNDFTKYFNEITLLYSCVYLQLSDVERVIAELTKKSLADMNASTKGFSIPSFALDIALGRNSNVIASFLLLNGCRISQDALSKITHNIFPSFATHVITCYL